MRTYCFIGSDKNAGKTTAFNFVYQKMSDRKRDDIPICLTSTGITGKAVDSFYGNPKPAVVLREGSYFITTGEQLKSKTGRYEVLHAFSRPEFAENYILGKCLSEVSIILEGPNCRQEILQAKRIIETLLPNGFFLIDGSVDRQFLANPEISDAFFFAVRITGSAKEVQRARALILSLSLPLCPEKERTIFKSFLREGTKSMLIDDIHTVCYAGEQIPFLDTDLTHACRKHQGTACFLYLNGWVSASLFSFLSGLKNFSIVLDNFTLYPHAAGDLSSKLFLPALSLYSPLTVKKIFIKQESPCPVLASELSFPKNVPVHNLFRENLDEIGI